jgi:hypothetical protein
MFCGCSKFRQHLVEEGALDVQKRLENEFPAWFRSHVSCFSLYFQVHIFPGNSILLFSVQKMRYLYFGFCRSSSCGRIIMKRLVMGYMHYHVVLTLECIYGHHAV